MKIEKIKNNEIALIHSEELLVKDIDSALDLFISISYESSFNKIIIYKSNIVEDFFDLSTQLLGHILQKLRVYNIKLAIVGDFSIYNSKSLKDFIYESNQGDFFYFVNTKEEAIEKLS